MGQKNSAELGAESSSASAQGTVSTGASSDGTAQDMAAPACRVSFRESVAKMRWTASSLDSLRIAEDRLLVSPAVNSSSSAQRNRKTSPKIHQ